MVAASNMVAAGNNMEAAANNMASVVVVGAVEKMGGAVGKAKRFGGHWGGGRG